jgi:hypothetical protein
VAAMVGQGRATARFEAEFESVTLFHHCMVTFCSSISTIRN